MNSSLKSRFLKRNKERPELSSLVNFIHILRGAGYTAEEKLDNLDLIDKADFSGKKSKAETVTYLLSVE